LWIFFFRGRPASAWLADAVGGPVGQAGVEFLAAAADGIDVPAEDEGDARVAAVAELAGLEGGELAALLLVQAAGEEVHLLMQPTVGVIGLAEAVGALARVDDAVSHDDISEWCPRGTAWPTRTATGRPAGI
jgi:hypothetical protein